MDDKGWVRPTVLNSPLDPTRARPEPWFVGNGRGLMVAIVSLCAVLLVARGVTIVWMAEEAWAWFRSPAGALAPPSPPLFTADERVTTPAAPADVGARPVAKEAVDLAGLFGRESYPLEALRLDQQGRVVARLAIGVDGRPTGCSVLESSRSAALDRTTCAIGFRRARFHPARDAAGSAVPSRYDLKVRWTLED